MFEENIECVDFLLAIGAEVNTRDIFGNTSLIHAAAQGNLNCLEILLSNHAYQGTKNYHNETALDLATQNHQDEYCAYLSKYDVTDLFNIARNMDASITQLFNFNSEVKKLNIDGTSSPEDESTTDSLEQSIFVNSCHCS